MPLTDSRRRWRCNYVGEDTSARFQRWWKIMVDEGIEWRWCEWLKKLQMANDGKSADKIYEDVEALGHSWRRRWWVAEEKNDDEEMMMKRGWKLRVDGDKDEMVWLLSTVKQVTTRYSFSLSPSLFTHFLTDPPLLVEGALFWPIFHIGDEEDFFTQKCWPSFPEVERFYLLFLWQESHSRTSWRTPFYSPTPNLSYCPP